MGVLIGVRCRLQRCRLWRGSDGCAMEVGALFVQALLLRGIYASCSQLSGAIVTQSRTGYMYIYTYTFTFIYIYLCICIYVHTNYLFKIIRRAALEIATRLVQSTSRGRDAATCVAPHESSERDNTGSSERDNTACITVEGGLEQGNYQETVSRAIARTPIGYTAAAPGLTSAHSYVRRGTARRGGGSDATCV